MHERLEQPLAAARAWRGAVTKDVSNVLRYGRDAPRRHQLIQVERQALDRWLRGPQRRQLAGASGHVLDGDWDLDTGPITALPKIRFCFAHWVGGLTWEETGAYDRHLREIATAGGRYDGCSTLDDVVARYEQLDTLFERVARERRLRTRRELPDHVFRELGGIGVHIVRDGEPVWGFDGSHRLAMAWVLELPWVPAQLGVVHRAALGSWRQRFAPPAERSVSRRVTRRR